MSESRQSLSNNNAYANCWKSFLLCILRAQRKMTCNINPARLLLINGNQAEYTKYYYRCN